VYFVECLIATLYAAAVFAERLDRLGARLGLPEALLGLDVLPARATMALVGGLLVSCMVVVTPARDPAAVAAIVLGQP
jgi:hypothetical protein